MAERVVRVGIQAVVVSEARILLGRRAGAFARGTWGLPGGHLEVGETILEAAARELYEETGLATESLRVFCVTDPNPYSNYHMQIGVEVSSYRGEPSVMEPHRCSGLDFFPLDQLPSPLFVSSVDVIANFKSGSIHLPQNSSASRAR